ncbi:MAG TPA: nuclear transport factor 2 family protein [Gemmatales bacterium]|nr:nuclear transport factor 2 family protein [Gemmatales bacterium]
MSKPLQLALLHPVGRYTLLLLSGLLVGLVAYRSMAERPLWAYFTLAVIGLVPLALFVTNRRVAHLYGLTVVAALMAGVYLADELQETDREQVLRISNELMRAVTRADHAVFERYLAPDYRWHGMNKAAMMQRVRTALLPNESRSCSVSSVKVNGVEGSDTLNVEGNLTASGTFGREEGFFSGTIELQYQKQSDGKYQVTGTIVKWYNGGEVTLPPGR